MDRLQSLGQQALDQPEAAEVWLCLGEALLELGALDVAHHTLAKARACGPQGAAEWSALGKALRTLGDRAGALEALRAAAVLDVERPAAVLEFAAAAVALGAHAEAESLLRERAGLAGIPERAALLAQICAARGADEEALQLAVEAASLAQPPKKDDVALAARLAARLGRAELEERMQAILHKLDPDDHRALIRLATLQAAKGRTEAARAALHALPSNASLGAAEREQLGALWLSLGAPERARAEHMEAARLAPDAAGPRVGLAEAARALGALEEAVTAYRAALILEPERPGVQRGLGEVLMQAGLHEEAAVALMRAAAEAPEDPELRAALTRALLMGGGVETAASRDSGLSGDLSVFHLEELLEFLGLQRASGRLHLRSGGQEGVIRLYEGRLVDVEYPGLPSLAAALVARGLVSRAWLDALPAARKGGDADLIRALLEVPPGPRPLPTDFVERVIRARVEQGVETMLRWSSGQARFEKERVNEPAFAFGHQDVLMSVFTRQDEAQA